MTDLGTLAMLLRLLLVLALIGVIQLGYIMVRLGRIEKAQRPAGAERTTAT